MYSEDLVLRQITPTVDSVFVWSFLNLSWLCLERPECVWSILNPSQMCLECPECVCSILNLSWICLERPERAWSFLNVSGVSWMCREHIEYVPNVSRATLTAISLEPRISRNTRWLYCLQCFTYTRRMFLRAKFPCFTQTRRNASVQCQERPVPRLGVSLRGKCHCRTSPGLTRRQLNKCRKSYNNNNNTVLARLKL